MIEMVKLWQVTVRDGITDNIITTEECELEELITYEDDGHSLEFISDAEHEEYKQYLRLWNEGVI